MNNIISRLGRSKTGRVGIIGTSLFSLNLFLNSCTTAQKAIVGGTLISATARTSKEALAGSILAMVGRLQYNIDVAEAGKDEGDEVNVYYPGASPNNSYKSYDNNYSYKNNYGVNPRHMIDLRQVIENKGLNHLNISEPEYNKIITDLKMKGYVSLNPNQEDFRITHMKYHPVLSQIYGSFIYSKNMDFNNNGNISAIVDEYGNHSLMEFVGLGETAFDISEKTLRVGFNVPDRESYQIVTWTSLTENNEIIGKTKKLVPKGNVQSWYIGPEGGYSDPKDFLDKVKDHFQQSYADWVSENRDKGEFRKAYKVTTTIRGDPRVFTEDFEIIKK